MTHKNEPCYGLTPIADERLTYFHNGRRYRLTDVAGEVIHKVLA